VREDTWQSRLCIFWYIVLVDLALHFIFSNTELPAVLALSALRWVYGPDVEFVLGKETITGILYGVHLWLNIAVRAFEFSVMLYWLDRRAGSVLSEFGLSREKAGRGALAGIVTGVALGGGFFLLHFCLLKWGGTDLIKKLGLAGRAKYELTGFYQVSYIFAGGLAAAFFEDVIFLGLLFGALRKRLSLGAAFGLTLAHFIVAHAVMNLLLPSEAATFAALLKAHAPQILIWTVGGTVFLTLYAVFESLVPSMIVHCVGNLLIFYAGVWHR
jgi:membrane protease YdiL (CAAX protease family)